MLALASLAAQTVQGLPPGATALDNVFAYGILGLLIALVWWNARSSEDPPGS